MYLYSIVRSTSAHGLNYEKNRAIKILDESALAIVGITSSHASESNRIFTNKERHESSKLPCNVCNWIRGQSGPPTGSKAQVGRTKESFG